MHLEISSLSSPHPDQGPAEKHIPEEVSSTTSSSQEIQFVLNKKIAKEASTISTSGGYLAKPSNIYAEEPLHLQSKTEHPVEEPSPLQMDPLADGPTIEMQLVIKNSQAADESGVRSTQSENNSVEEPAMQDEAEDQKRRAAERLNKLRNLSFNVNAADPNNEFETVPAYVRRNFQLQNALASVEKFYSNYTVKPDENNQAQISTINTFLDGKKPD